MRVGTLTYTKAGLIGLFLFLLWGDFCFSLMETVVPSVLPLKFNAIGAPNWVLGLVVLTIPSLMNAIINPVVSFWSDRFRSKWGRRIPFLAGATPFVAFFLILLGYSEPISRWLQPILLGGKFSKTSVLIGVIGGFVVCFQFFNLFITSVYYYLFNDVVPRAFIARFMSLFRIVGGGAGSFYSFFLLKYAVTNMGEVFLGAALLYLVAFTVMCLKVREGKYAPPPSYIGKEHGLVAAVKTYATECFTHRFYWWYYLSSSCIAMTWVGASFSILVWTRVMGFDLGFVGEVTGICGVLTLILLYPSGIIADRFHPLRIFLGTSIISNLLAPLTLVFIWIPRDYLSLHMAQWLFIGWNAVNLPFIVLNAAADLPTTMKLFPRDRFGQFCSANALIRSIAMMMGGVACGALLDLAKKFNPNPDLCYRYVYVWNTFFQVGTMIFLFLVYSQWKRLGGFKSYRPPGVEAQDEMLQER